MWTKLENYISNLFIKIATRLRRLRVGHDGGLFGCFLEPTHRNLYIKIAPARRLCVRRCDLSVQVHTEAKSTSCTWQSIDKDCGRTRVTWSLLGEAAGRRSPKRAKLPGSSCRPCARARAALHLVIWRNVFLELLLLERLGWSP